MWLLRPEPTRHMDEWQTQDRGPMHEMRKAGRRGRDRWLSPRAWSTIRPRWTTPSQTPRFMSG